MICSSCAGVAVTWLSPLVKCRDCITAWARETVLVRDVETEHRRSLYVGDMQRVLMEVARPGTAAINSRGLREFLVFSHSMRLEVLPALPITLCLWMVWAVFHRSPTLDTSTLDTYLQGVGVWHLQTAEVTGFSIPNPVRDPLVTHLLLALSKLYKKPSAAKQPMEPAVWLRVAAVGFDLGFRLGLFSHLLFLVLTAGPLRPIACKGIRVDYQVVQLPGGGLEVVYLPTSTIRVASSPDIPDQHIQIDLTKDKNVDARNQRLVIIPKCFMGINMVATLTHYLITVRPPPGKLFRCPKGGGGPGQGRVPTQVLPPGRFAEEHMFQPGDYTAHCQMVRRGYIRAFPEATDAMTFGGGSPRKGTADWLWMVGTFRRVIADIGGWSVRTDAVDLYFKTRPRQVHQIMSALATDLLSKECFTAAQLSGIHNHI
jgi:hypothetical protein